MKFSEFKNLVPNGSIELVNNAIVINANELLGRNVTWDTDIESLLFYCLHKLSKGVNKRANFTYGFPIVENGELWVYSQVGFTVKLPAKFNNLANADDTLPDQDSTDPITQRQNEYPPSMFVSNLRYSMNLPNLKQVIVGISTEDALILFNYGDTALQISIWVEGWAPPEDFNTLQSFNASPGIISFMASEYPKYVRVMLDEGQSATYKIEIAENSPIITLI